MELMVSPYLLKLSGTAYVDDDIVTQCRLFLYSHHLFWYFIALAVYSIPVVCAQSPLFLTCDISWGSERKCELWYTISASTERRSIVWAVDDFWPWLPRRPPPLTSSVSSLTLAYSLNLGFFIRGAGLRSPCLPRLMHVWNVGRKSSTEPDQYWDTSE